MHVLPGILFLVTVLLAHELADPTAEHDEGAAPEAEAHGIGLENLLREGLRDRGEHDHADALDDRTDRDGGPTVDAHDVKDNRHGAGEAEHHVTGEEDELERRDARQNDVDHERDEHDHGRLEAEYGLHTGDESVILGHDAAHAEGGVEHRAERGQGSADHRGAGAQDEEAEHGLERAHDDSRGRVLHRHQTDEGDETHDDGGCA